MINQLFLFLNFYLYLLDFILKYQSKKSLQSNFVEYLIKQENFLLKKVLKYLHLQIFDTKTSLRKQ
ncbi:hypothetical protein TTHERM_000616289 (macronuclear) [Tetrahymena thermophila SB210]|uniref:Transmembrane protein n=1 Tax=Tetrahymena thermophila (strain SB210) TaxID=312017 RepID=W7XDF1_TETTS|nr:hypothetical protein TTHERM_000616289 [Tetrahymena thermophila SB210]EWS71841.1 hypothetical protein TTHERM_000616289 [Tetrahymena thermophila SB210]|eukprot:XP_012655634.1 hypothetical protein TTHERM_000616289 [Tetrahymena thermophila SB210]